MRPKNRSSASNGLGRLVLLLIGAVAFSGNYSPIYTQQTGGTIYGLVTDLLGHPWPNARVEVRAQGFIDGPSRLAGGTLLTRSGISDRHGMYSISGLPEDSYDVIIKRMNGGTLEEIKHIGVLRDKRRVDFGVEVGSISECTLSIYGRVIDRSGKPVEGAKVSVQSAFKEALLRSGETDRLGEYQITVCSPAQYLVFINKPEFSVAVASAIIESPRTKPKRIDFSLRLLTRLEKK